MSNLELTIESRFTNVNLVGSCINILAAEAFDSHVSYQIQTCVVEAVTNCIEHGYQQATGHTVKIQCKLDSVKLAIDISDTGTPMSREKFESISTDFYFDPLDIENIPDGGWGIKIIKIWMDEYDYFSENGTNHFLMVKYVPHEIPAPSSGESPR